MSTVDNIKDLPIEDVIQKYSVALKKKGANYWGCCPFHNEKTPSFSVSPAKNIFKCFGCGAGGDAISFVMLRKNMSFPEAIKDIAGEFGIPYSGFSNEDNAVFEKRKSLKESVKWLCDYYVSCLSPDCGSAYKYVQSRWDVDEITMYQIGFAPVGFEVIDLAKKSNNFENLKALGYLRAQDKSPGKYYPMFQNRIMIPIWDAHGNVVAFSGRTLDPADDRKYINSYESEIFAKNKILYALNFAHRSIIEKKTAYLVEGQPDVIKLHRLGKPNVVGSMGTALADDQISALKRITSHVTIIGDYDAPSKGKDNNGELAMLRNAVRLVENGLMVNLVFIKPENPLKKEDPDSFFENEVQFDAYISENTKDYFVWRCKESAIKASNNKLFHSELISEVCTLLLNYDPSTRETYIEDLSKIIRPKKAWSEKMKELTNSGKNNNDNVFDKSIPANVNRVELDKYGFYEENNMYFFRSTEGYTSKTNFVLRPIMHIPSNTNAKRIFEIINVNKFRTIIELAQKDLNTVQGFKLRVESIGNFLYEGSEIDMNKLKRWLYETTDICEEISQLGWQKQGFWAWANGIYVPGQNSEFVPVDEYGIVDFNGKKYYLPAFSKIFEKDNDLFQSERKFVYKPGTVSSFDYMKKFQVVYGRNAIIAFSFFFATLFRDVFFSKFDSFPILNFFGPKGTGKSDMAIALLKFFGHQGKGPNIVNSTKPAMADHLSLYANSLCHVDEYKNSVEPDKIEFLKSVYDGTGRTRMNMDRDKKKETTKVDVGLMLCGQEMPTLDIALFSRLIFMVFHKTEFTETEKDLFEELKSIQYKGLGHIVHELLDFRNVFIKSWLEYYNQAYEELKQNKQAHVEERIIKSFSVLLCAFNFFHDNIKLPFDKPYAFKVIRETMVNQNQEVKTGNEVSIFWKIFENNATEGTLLQEVDYKVDMVSSLKTNMVDCVFNEPKTVLYIRMTRIVTQYRKTGLAMREAILPAKTIDYYLKNSNAFLGTKNSMKFMIPDVMKSTDIESRESRVMTSAYCFDYKMLDIDVIRYKSQNFNDSPEHDFEFKADNTENIISPSSDNILPDAVETTAEIQFNKPPNF